MDSLTAPARSWLFVPANRPERFAKAAASDADRIIVDLEDAVAPADKVAARDALVDTELPSTKPVYLRVNAASTDWFFGDIEIVSRLKLSGVLLPKAESTADVERVAAQLGDGVTVAPIIETAAGMWNVRDVARARRVERLIFGALDFELDTGIQEGDDTFAYARSRIAIASRVASLAPPVDAVTIAIDDEARLRADAARSRRFGFGGKLCIHPKQAAALNMMFAPTADEFAWAESILTAHAQRSSDAVFAFNGTMVDRPVVERAKRIRAAAAAHATK